MPAELAITVCPPSVADIGPPSTRYWIGIAAGSQVKGCPSTPKFGLPTNNGPPACNWNGRLRAAKVQRLKRSLTRAAKRVNVFIVRPRNTAESVPRDATTEPDRCDV